MSNGEYEWDDPDEEVNRLFKIMSAADQERRGGEDAKPSLNSNIKYLYIIQNTHVEAKARRLLGGNKEEKKKKKKKAIETTPQYRL